MKKITALTAQKHDAARVTLFLDGEFAFGLPLASAARLNVGQELSAAEIVQLQGEDSLAHAHQAATNLIARRPRSVAEIQLSLRRKGVEEAQIAHIVARLQEAELLDDEAFAHYWVDQRETFKPRSPQALRQELMQKGVDSRIIEQVLAQLDVADSARRLAVQRARRWTQLSYEEYSEKMMRFLRGRGFQYEIIKEVTDEIWQEIKSHT
jgi:regulatory protein